MVEAGSKYDHGRGGAEIAYTVATDRLGLKDVVLVEPSRGGKDLYTGDGRVVIQARMLTDRDVLSSSKLGDTLQAQFVDMVSKLKEDFRYNPLMTNGYGILSYVEDDGNVTTIIVEVPRSSVLP